MPGRPRLLLRTRAALARGPPLMQCHENTPTRLATRKPAPISPTMVTEACLILPKPIRKSARSTTTSAFDPRQHPSRGRREDPAPTQADQPADQLHPGGVTTAGPDRH